MSTVYDWSQTSANNANSDNQINWAEGQPPSSVNNSARVMMQRIAEYIKDIGGSLTAGGTANAITLTIASTVTKYIDGLQLTFSGRAANTGNTTININSIGAKNIYKTNGASVVALSGNEILQNAIYQVVYRASLNGGQGGFFLMNPSQTIPDVMPAGAIIMTAAPISAIGWIYCNGATYASSKYPKLYTAIGTRYGGNATNFKVPDYRGYFLRGFDDGTGRDKNREFGKLQTDQNKEHTHGASMTENGAHTHTYTKPNLFTASGPTGSGGWSIYTEKAGIATSQAGNHKHTITIAKDGGTEARPINMPVYHYIKT